MANVNLLVKEEEEKKIKNALEINDLNEVNINITKKKKTGFLGTYSIVFHDSVKTLSKMNLKPNSYKIVMYLFSIIEMGNVLIGFSQKKIATDLGLQPSNVSRSFKELFEKGILIKDSKDGHIFLNSNLCTMGIPKNFSKDKIEKLQKSSLENEHFKNQINLFPSTSNKIGNNKKANVNKEDNVLKFPDDENNPF